MKCYMRNVGGGGPPAPTCLLGEPLKAASVRTRKRQASSDGRIARITISCVGMTRDEEAVQAPQDVEVAVQVAGTNNDSNQPETVEDLTEQQGQCALLLMSRVSLQRLQALPLALPFIC